jgi:AcrR family transcriptional regulator
MNARSFLWDAMKTGSDPGTEQATKGERTRLVIIDAGYRLFVRQGYNATSMRQIADEAGLALGAAYNYFAGKEELWMAVLFERHPFNEIMPALVAAHGDTVEALVRDAATRMIAILEQRQEILNLVLIELVEFDGRHAPQLFEKFFPPLMSFMQRVIQAGGSLRPNPPPIILRAFLGLFFSYFVTERFIGGQLSTELREGAFDHFVDMYLHGIVEA